MVCCVIGYFELCDMLVSDDNVGFVIFKKTRNDGREWCSEVDVDVGDPPVSISRYSILHLLSSLVGLGRVHPKM